MSEPLITRYRPRDFDEMVGHEEIIDQLQRVLAQPSHPHAFLFTGPSGVGKTTLARIICTMLDADLMEIDAASHSGIDAMRELVDLSSHVPLTGKARRFMLIDEAHAISKPGFQALLKLIEEPPSHLYLALCTTELQKVPDTIGTRCYKVPLRILRNHEIEDLLLAVIAAEDYNVPDDVLAVVVQAATGQPRKALSILQSVQGVESRDEVRRIISLQDASEPVIALMSHLVAGHRDWAIMRGLIARIDEDNYDEVGIVAGRYLSACILKTESSEQAARLFRCLEGLLYPARSFDPKVVFLSAIFRMIWE